MIVRRAGSLCPVASIWRKLGLADCLGMNRGLDAYSTLMLRSLYLRVFERRLLANSTNNTFDKVLALLHIGNMPGWLELKHWCGCIWQRGQVPLKCLNLQFE